MRVDVLTLFPEFVDQAAAVGVVGRARQRGLLDLRCWNPRDYARDNYRTIDDRPFGGGPGMVMMSEPLRRALEALRADAADRPRLVYLSPQGPRLTQRTVERLAREPRLALLCGRYEGVDERFLEREVDEELSIGDYVLSGGELAALVLIDAVGRLQEGALGHGQSAAQDSFATGLLDCPHYTRPERDGEDAVPAVLQSGDHAEIRRWRLQQALGRTWLRRPDLLARVSLDAEARGLLQGYIDAYFASNPPHKAEKPL
ncbi:MAG TPA: tRNA (guanosine(37)-N1)-methyltransferase TrmD [Xanthomonadaceae bacterium]|nr:tRNA (guanosine(37)-N1)-methyltransferase TrmD [Xanthomonadaceae bacterium]